MEQAIFIWNKITENKIRLLRAFGTDSVVTIPEWIDGRQVAEIGAYCFSRRKLPEGELYYTIVGEVDSTSELHLNVEKSEILSAIENVTGNFGILEKAENEKKTERLEADFWQKLEQFSYLHELSEKYIQQVQLPPSIKKVGACAFYNCTKMTELVIFPALEEIGSDAFMNCLSLHTICMRAHCNAKTGLKQLLAQVKWQVTVQFVPEDTFKNDIVIQKKNSIGSIQSDEKSIQKYVTEAVILYPEYYEGYDEIGPAHIFELNLSGEGFRARQCFKDGVLQYASYDEIFPQACVEEKTEVLLEMAWNRLMYDWELTEEAKLLYEAYVRAHGRTCVHRLLSEKKLEELHLFFQKGYGSEMLMDEAVQTASEEAWPEAVASIVAWKREIYAPKVQSVKSRYSFDEF